MTSPPALRGADDPAHGTWLPPAHPEGRLLGIRTRSGAEPDLSRSPGEARAVLRPTRSHRVELRTSAGTRPLYLVAGEDHVLTLGTW